MSFGRIRAIFLRYFYYFAKFDHLSEMFYWPTIDIFLWGMMSIWVQGESGAKSDVALLILTGLVFWQVIWRASYEITMNVLQEFWNRNLVNLFSTPLRLGEWMAATMLTSFTKILITLAFSSSLVWLLYSLNIFNLGLAIIPFIAMLTVSGWMMGYFSAGIIVYFGQRYQMLAWMMPFVFAPFSAVFYPLSALPPWGQFIAKGLPMTYIFQGMRQVLQQGTFSTEMFWMSALLNTIFLFLTMAFFKIMFERSREKGLSRLE
ncbi:MAG: ABC transporter permease [Verrucomicrobia bacterium]|nr:ABC transporter permease [Verrucomicrobiota bacterium]